MTVGDALMQAAHVKNMTAARRRKTGTSLPTKSSRASILGQPMSLDVNNQIYSDASSRLNVSDMSILAMPTSPNTLIEPSSQLCLVCDEGCTCGPPPLSQLTSNSSILSKYVKTLSNVDKDTLLQALKLSPHVFNSITQSLKRKKIFASDEPNCASLDPLTPPPSQESLYIIDNNVSYDHHAIFYNHLNYISSTSASSSMLSSSSFEENYNTLDHDPSLDPCDDKRPCSEIVSYSPPNNNLIEELLEIDSMVDDSPLACKELERIFSRLQTQCQSSLTRRRPSIPPLRKIPKIAAFRNPHTDPFINDLRNDAVYYEKVTSWLSPSETSSLISALAFDDKSQDLLIAEDNFREFVDNCDNELHVQPGDIFTSTTIDEQIYASPGKMLSAGLFRDLPSNVILSDDSSNEFVEIEFPGGYSDDLDDDDDDDNDDEDEDEDEDEDKPCHQKWPLNEETKKKSSLINSESYLVDYSYYDELYPFLSSSSSLDTDAYSTCDCIGICFCGAFLEIEMESEVGVGRSIAEDVISYDDIVAI